MADTNTDTDKNVQDDQTTTGEASGETNDTGAAGEQAPTLADITKAAGAVAARKDAEAAAADRSKDTAADKAEGDGSQSKESETGKGGEKTPAEKADDDKGFKPTETQIKLAKALGITDGEIAAMTPAEIKAVDRVARLDSRRQAKIAFEKARDKGGDGGDGKDAGGAGSSAAGAVTFDEDTYGPELAAVLTGMQTRLEQQDATIARLQDGNTNESTNATEKAVKDFFEGLDAEIFADYDPEAGDVEANSLADLKRAEVVDEAVALRQRFAKRGNKISVADSLEKALTIVDSEATQAAAQKTGHAKRQKRSRQRIAAPSATETGGRTYRTEKERVGAEVSAKINRNK